MSPPDDERSAASTSPEGSVRPAIDAEAPPPARGLPAPARGLLVLGLLYLFLVGVALLEAGIGALGSGFQEGLLASVENPVAGLFAGILATVLVQSSSVSTSTIVGLVGSGALTVTAAVPMVMGANIGTTVTNTLASLGSIRRRDEFVRAFAGATVHDFFNLLAVAVFLPVELATGILSRTAGALADVLRSADVRGGEASSPIKDMVKAPVGLIEDGFESLVGIGTAEGVLLLAAGLACIFAALAYITRNMRALVALRVERALNRFVGGGGGVVGMLLGVGVTVAVQSSSITTSIMVPLVAAGVLTLESVYPITLGSNVGTTITALIASLAVDLQAGLVIALTHTLFNLGGIVLLYPIPGLRHLPLRLARGLARQAVARRGMVGAYVVATFVIIPLAGIAILR